MIKDENILIQRCLELAINASGSVAPNPMVGVVITHNGKIIGEGWHRNFGGAHAEVNAVNSVKDKAQLKNSTLYVNLEPCCYHGKTPACTEFIIRKKISKVVIGCYDPNPKVAGKGVQQLRKAGITVKTGVMERECKMLNRRFFTFYEKKRPYIILKWAQSADGFIAPKGQGGVQLSNVLSQTIVHKWRSEEQAIMIGTNTAILDNPHLSTRKWKGNNPTRIIIDRNLRIPNHHNIFDNTIPTIVFTDKERKKENNLEFIRISFSKNCLQNILLELFRKNILSIIVEGGAQLLSSFIKEDLWDEARVFITDKRLVSGVQAPVLSMEP